MTLDQINMQIDGYKKVKALIAKADADTVNLPEKIVWFCEGQLMLLQIMKDDAEADEKAKITNALDILIDEFESSCHRMPDDVHEEEAREFYNSKTVRNLIEKESKLSHTQRRPRYDY